MKYILLLLLLTSCAPEKGKECGTYKNVYGMDVVHKNIPIVFGISGPSDESYYKDIIEVAAEINKAAGKNLLIVTADNITKNEIIFPIPWSEASEKLGFTRFKWTNSYGILETDIYINTTHFKYGEGAHDFKTLMRHEFLHALGFEHVDNSLDLMYPYQELGVKKYLTADTIKRLKCAYE